MKLLNCILGSCRLIIALTFHSTNTDFGKQFFLNIVRAHWLGFLVGIALCFGYNTNLKHVETQLIGTIQ